MRTRPTVSQSTLAPTTSLTQFATTEDATATVLMPRTATDVTNPGPTVSQTTVAPKTSLTQFATIEATTMATEVPTEKASKESTV